MSIDWRNGGAGFVGVDSGQFETLTVGPPPGGAAATIVLLHEGLGSVGLWRDFPKHLSEATGRGVFAYSRAGYGKSSPAPLPLAVDYMQRHAVEILPRVLDALGAGRVILIGHSDGASIAAYYAGAVQDRRVRGLVLMAPHFFTEPEGLAAIAKARDAYETGGLRERLARHHADVDNAFRGWNDAWLNPAFHNWTIEDAIDTIRVPVLAIQGRDDQYGTLAQLGALETRLFAPYESLILDNCRHAPFSERPEETLDAITRFIARLERIEAEAVAVS